MVSFASNIYFILCFLIGWNYGTTVITWALSTFALIFAWPTLRWCLYITDSWLKWWLWLVKVRVKVKEHCLHFAMSDCLCQDKLIQTCPCKLLSVSQPRSDVVMCQTNSYPGAKTWLSDHLLKVSASAREGRAASARAQLEPNHSSLAGSAWLEHFCVSSHLAQLALKTNSALVLARLEPS